VWQCHVACDSFAATRILIVATHRFGYSPPFGTRSFQTRMTLGPLSEADALTMPAACSASSGSRRT
jgi:hypothetical protein